MAQSFQNWVSETDSKCVFKKWKKKILHKAKKKKKLNTTGPIISGNATFSGELREILYFGESKNNIKSPLSQMKIME